MIDPKKLDDIARKLKIGKYAKPGTELPPKDVKENVLEDEESFIFPKLANGCEYHLLKNLLDDKATKTQSYWLQRTGKETIINSRDLYQIMHRLYSLRDEEDEVVQNCIGLLRQDFTKNYPHTGTKIKYDNGLEGVVSHLQPDKSIWQSESIVIPEFIKTNDYWTHLVLAKEQPESELGNVEEITDNAKPVLEALFGKNYEDFGTVAQYLATRKNGNLCEVRLWVPSVKVRSCERALVFGVSNGNDWFGIYANGVITNVRPARGVVLSAQKNSSGSKG